MDRCVVFDADPNEAHIRAKMAIRAVGLLRGRGIDIGEVVKATSRGEVEESIRHGESLLLLDMTEAPYRGNVGARIARAITSRPEVARRTRRIIWTRHNWTTVLNGLDGFAHAIVRYVPDPERIDILAEAMAYVCKQPAAGPVATGAFPAAEDPDVRRTHLRRALADVLGKVERGDLEIAEALRHRIPDKRINAMLEAVERPRRASVHAFLTAIIDHGSATSLDDARDRVYREKLMPWTEHRVEDEISPEATETAAGALRHLTPEELPCFLEEHWLLHQELELCIAYIAAYEREARGAPKGVDREARWQAARRALTEEGFLAACEATGLGPVDLAYALHSIRDRRIDS